MCWCRAGLAACLLMEGAWSWWQILHSKGRMGGRARMQGNCSLERTFLPALEAFPSLSLSPPLRLPVTIAVLPLCLTNGLKPFLEQRHLCPGCCVTLPSFVSHTVSCQTCTPHSNSHQCDSTLWLTPGLCQVEREQWVAQLKFLPPPQSTTPSSSIWPRKHGIDIFDLSVFWSSSFFFILLTLIALSAAPVLFLMLLVSISAPLWCNLSPSLSSWPLFCVFDTSLSSCAVSFPSSVPPELISLGQITFFGPMDSSSTSPSFCCS